jgi:hypothetical protein
VSPAAGVGNMWESQCECLEYLLELYIFTVG